MTQDQGNPQVTTWTSKLAWRRDPSVPQGQAALGTFKCPCGGVIGPVPFGGERYDLLRTASAESPGYTCPGCGSRYDSRGWLVRS